MKGSVPPPSTSDLLRGYNQLQSQNFDLEDYVRLSAWARYDPRLAEILVFALRDHWSKWNPFEISSHLKKHPWPGTFGVLAEHVLWIVSPSDRRFFRSWSELCFYQVHFAMDYSVFYIGVFRFGGKFIRQEAFDSIPLYKKWGFLGGSPIIALKNAKGKSRKTFLSKAQRFEKLQTLIQQRQRIRLSDYLACLDFQISRRTAELDLKQWAIKSGQTKGATYTQKKKELSRKYKAL